MHWYSDVNKLLGVAKIGDGECVALVKRYTEVGSTIAWRAGWRVIERETMPLWPGTAIATFVNGRYPQTGHGSRHAAFFLGYGPLQADGMPSGIWIMEQYNTPPIPVVQERFIPRLRLPQRPDGTWPNASNNADAFYIIR